MDSNFPRYHWSWICLGPLNAKVAVAILVTAILLMIDSSQPMYYSSCSLDFWMYLSIESLDCLGKECLFL